MRRILIVLLALHGAFGLLPPHSAMATAPAPEELMIDDPALQLRATELARQLRCVTCPHQSLAESEAPIAIDMRRAIAAQLRAGQSDAAILEGFQRVYGDEVLLTPPVNAWTAALWLGPALLFLAAAGGLLLRARQSHGQREQAELMPLDAYGDGADPMPDGEGKAAP